MVSRFTRARAGILVLFLALSAVSLALAVRAVRQGSFQVTVHVVNEDGSPVSGARVVLDRRDSFFFDIFSGMTDENGVVVLQADKVGGEITEGGIYDIAVFGPTIKTANSEVNLVKRNGQRAYRVELRTQKKPAGRERALASFGHRITGRKADGDRTVTIKVRGHQVDGSLVPVHNATVYLPGQGIRVTDYNGVISLKHRFPLGESVPVMAEAPKYQPTETEFVVGQSGTALTAVQDGAEIVLEPIKAVKPMVVELQVLDHDTDLPVANATTGVDETRQGKQVRHLAPATNAKGESSVSLDGETLKGATFMAYAVAPGYDVKWSTIDADLLVPSDTPRVFTIYISRSSAWAGTWSDGSSTLTMTGGTNGLTGHQSWAGTVAHQTSISDYVGVKFLSPTHVTCRMPGQYVDDDKTIDYDYDVDLTLAGDTITGTFKVIKRVVTWKAGVAPYESVVAVLGTVSTATFKRKG